MTEMQTSQRKASFYASGFNFPVSYAYFCGEPEKEFAESGTDEIVKNHE